MPDDTPFNAERIHTSFGRQGLMRTLGARLLTVAPGRVEIELPSSDRLTQQHGYFHAGAVAAIADTAGGYAALSLMREDEDVLAVEFKVTLLRPAVGERLVAEGSVVKGGRTLIFCQNSVVAWRDGAPTTVAVMLQTNIRQASRR
jgi:uncharacterized protein (TIGR00369 family)